MGVKGFQGHSYNTVVLFCTLDALWWVCILLTWSELCILTFYHSYSPECDQETRSSWSKPSGTWRFYGLLLFKGWCLLFFSKCALASQGYNLLIRSKIPTRETERGAFFGRKVWMTCPKVARIWRNFPNESHGKPTHFCERFFSLTSLLF